MFFNKKNQKLELSKKLKNVFFNKKDKRYSTILNGGSDMSILGKNSYIHSQSIDTLTSIQGVVNDIKTKIIKSKQI